MKYTFSNVGNTFSAKSISDYLKSEHRTLDNETVYSYMEKLEKAYLLHRCSRYDLQGKEILKTQEKFYLADTALRYSVLGYNPETVAASLENVVYLGEQRALIFQITGILHVRDHTKPVCHRAVCQAAF